MATLPSGFTLIDEPSVQDAFVAETLAFNEVIIYNVTGADNMTYPYSSIFDHPDAPQFNTSMPSGEYTEVWWGLEGIPDVGTIGKTLDFRHTHEVWYGYEMIDYFTMYYTNGSSLGYYIQKPQLESAWLLGSNNGSAFTGKCGHASISVVILLPENYTDIGDAWDADLLSYAFSYEWSEEETGFNILSIIGQVLLFQGLELGVPSAFGSAINAILGVVFWFSIAFIVYKLITGLIPFVSGGG